jgi:hypothetical protein
MLLDATMSSTTFDLEISLLQEHMEAHKHNLETTEYRRMVVLHACKLALKRLHVSCHRGQ